MKYKEKIEKCSVKVDTTSNEHGGFVMKNFIIMLNVDIKKLKKTVKTFFTIAVYIVGIFTHEIYSNCKIAKATQTSNFHYNNCNYSDLDSLDNLLDAYAKMSQEYFDAMQNRIKNKDATEPYWNFVEICEPYEVSDRINYKAYTQNQKIKMAGEYRTNGFTSLCHNTYLLFNLGCKYSKLTLSMGHVDGEQMLDVEVSIYLDGQYYSSYIVKAQELPISISIPLDNIQQLKFSFNDGENEEKKSTKIGLVDMIIK